MDFKEEDRLHKRRKKAKRLKKKLARPWTRVLIDRATRLLSHTRRRLRKKIPNLSQTKKFVVDNTTQQRVNQLLSLLSVLLIIFFYLQAVTLNLLLQNADVIPLLLVLLGILWHSGLWQMEQQAWRLAYPALEPTVRFIIISICFNPFIWMSLIYRVFWLTVEEF